MSAESLWSATGPRPRRRERLERSIGADVVVVGAGYTGLWAAYHLIRTQPDLDIVVVEAEHVGFGASGRNGGWAVGDIAIDRSRAAARHGRGPVRALLHAVNASIDELGAIVRSEGIDCDFEKGGTLTFATSPAHVPRLQAAIAHEHDWGFGEADYRWLIAEETRDRARPRVCLGAMESPHCAALHPLKLVAGLAEVVEGAGVRIYEETAATAIEPGRVHTERGVVSAGTVLRCVEAYGVRFDRRAVVPLYSLMVGSEPLPEEVWAEIGLDRRQTFHDGRRLIIYGQRTADGRFAFGGRGAPYHFGSRIRPAYDHHAPTHRAVEAVLRDLFPQMGDARITHRWGGAVALPRDWSASVQFDPSTRIGSAGGFVGVGVAVAQLAGRTLADLVLERDTDLTHLPWVGHRSRRWEPEPLRWAGINLGRTLAPAADAVERRTGKPSKVIGGLFDVLTGHG